MSINSVDICSYSNFECGGYKGVMEVELTEAGKTWLQEHHPQSIHYRIPHTADGKPTIRKVE